MEPQHAVAWFCIPHSIYIIPLTLSSSQRDPCVPRLLMDAYQGKIPVIHNALEEWRAHDLAQLNTSGWHWCSHGSN